MGRGFFRKAVALRDKVKGVKVRPPSHKGKIVWTRRQVGTGFEYRYMSSAEAAKQRGRRNAGLLGRGHRWSSEEARAAALKSWRKHGRPGPYTGRRLGRKLACAKRVKRQPFRDLHEGRWFRGYRYDPSERQWWRGIPDTAPVLGRRVAERTALRNLGYLPKPGGYVPDEVHPVERKNK